MTKKIAIIILPGFALTSFSLTVEAFSVANLLERGDLYEYTVYSASDDHSEKMVTSSNGIKVKADKHISEFQSADFICLCAYYNASKFRNEFLDKLLKKYYSEGGYLASLSSGSFTFARIGILKNRTCTVTSEQEDVFRELYPSISLVESLYTVNHRIYTCRGGATALDMMMYIIGNDYGTDLTERISQRFQTAKIRTFDEINKSNRYLKLNLKSPVLATVVEIMESNIEEPYSIEYISEIVGVSNRNIEQLFKKHFDISPNKYYLKVRLAKALKLVEETHLPMLDIASACGFSSHSYMGKCFKKEFGFYPSVLRK
ncbi:GlxA family transcriptional regulator [Marinomonas ostreistagni]|uniref:Helix-turn-helix domain-containing protein n=1 Tax=Marinomonas ostreistagni TaxID=359209 RepID=A0ABS0ZFV3_9GAMM|nr:helix-turn-helix domain-containing protein [Marinomonas ostreistagni]MBJ7552053.1 helix-turn-helix domain-containing protein [Marinomonas ostreistagni]